MNWRYYQIQFSQKNIFVITVYIASYLCWWLNRTFTKNVNHVVSQQDQTPAWCSQSEWSAGFEYHYFHIFTWIKVLKFLLYAPLRSVTVHISMFRGELMATSMWVFKHILLMLQTWVVWRGTRATIFEVFGVHIQHNMKCFPLRMSAKQDLWK